MRTAVRSLLAAMAMVACSTVVGDTPVATVGSTVTVPPTPTTTTLQERDCSPTRPQQSPVTTGSVPGDLLALSRELLPCANRVVVVGEEDLTLVALAAQHAAAIAAPLLHPGPELASELARLDPYTVYVVGNAMVEAPPGAQVLRLTGAQASARSKEALGAGEEIGLPAVPDASTVVETLAAMNAGSRVVTRGSEAASPPAAVDPATVIRGLASPSGSEFAWMVPASQPGLALAVAPLARMVGASVLAYETNDVLAYPEIGPALSGRPPSAIRYLGAAPAAPPWELEVLLRSGPQVPGGGYRVFPSTVPRRYVAFYGNPHTASLGALGEQGPAETLARMQPLIAEYAADGSQVIPTFEIIASVASAGPTDGDYSEEWPAASFEEWIRFAAENGMYVILDLQSGREDFLSQAMQYQDLLLLPHVGLALDPEWRLQPDQVHLRQVGQVTAAEVNTVVDWLADLVRDNGLPQKMLIVHQFQSRMIVDRETLKQRPELQMVVQMDGQGPIPTKDETYAALTAGTEGVHWRWGWKNFFDEDSPETASPAYTVDHEPAPVFVSYQ